MCFFLGGWCKAFYSGGNAGRDIQKYTAHWSKSLHDARSPDPSKQAAVLSEMTRVVQRVCRLTQALAGKPNPWGAVTTDKKADGWAAHHHEVREAVQLSVEPVCLRTGATRCPTSSTAAATARARSPLSSSFHAEREGAHPQIEEGGESTLSQTLGREPSTMNVRGWAATGTEQPRRERAEISCGHRHPGDAPWPGIRTAWPGTA